SKAAKATIATSSSSAAVRSISVIRIHTVTRIVVCIVEFEAAVNAQPSSGTRRKIRAGTATVTTASTANSTSTAAACAVARVVSNRVIESNGERSTLDPLML